MSNDKKDNRNQTTGNFSKEKTNQNLEKKQPKPSDTPKKPNEEMPKIGDHSKLKTTEEAADRNKDQSDKSKRYDKQTDPKKSDKRSI
jgi:hypothetical protein